MSSASDGDVTAVATAIERAIAGQDFRAIGELFAEDVTWGDCAGRSDAQAFLDQATETMPPIAGGTVDEIDDRLVVAIVLDGPGDPAMHVAVFVEDGQIIEIIHAEDPEDAAAVQPVGPLPEAAARVATMRELAPVLAVADISTAVEHYRTLGFVVEHYEGGAAYAFAGRDGVNLHLTQVKEVDPKTNMSAVYLYVDDADALYAEWRLAPLAGRLVAPIDTPYDLREGAHIDPDGNLLRFGSAMGA